mgnify:CR=1 FL=1
MNWRDTLAEIIYGQMIEQGGFIDLEMAEAELRQQCPPSVFKLDWRQPDNLALFDRLDQDRVNVVFDDDRARVEWLLKWG